MLGSCSGDSDRRYPQALLRELKWYYHVAEDARHSDKVLPRGRDENFIHG